MESLNENTNVPLLSQQIVDKCKFIHASKISHVENLLYMLKERKNQDDKLTHMVTKKKSDKDESLQKKLPSDDEPSLTKLESYIEKLYETPEERLSSTLKILKLAQNQDNLEPLLQDGTYSGHT